LIEVTDKIIKVAVNGKENAFAKTQIRSVHLKSVRQLSAVVSGLVLGGFLGTLILQVNCLFGVMLLLVGAIVFHYGMEWHQRLEINLHDGMVLTITFLYRGVGDIRKALDKHGYLGKSLNYFV